MRASLLFGLPAALGLALAVPAARADHGEPAPLPCPTPCPAPCPATPACPTAVKVPAPVIRLEMAAPEVIVLPPVQHAACAAPAHKPSLLEKCCHWCKPQTVTPHYQVVPLHAAPVAAAPVAAPLTFAQPTFAQPTFAQPTFAQPTFAAPITFSQPTFAQPTFAQPTFAAPITFSQPTFAAPQVATPATQQMICHPVGATPAAATPAVATPTTPTGADVNDALKRLTASTEVLTNMVSRHTDILVIQQQRLDDIDERLKKIEGLPTVAKELAAKPAAPAPTPAPEAIPPAKKKKKDS